MDIEETQSNRAVDLLAENKQQAEKIRELERIIVDAKACVKITQERNDELQAENTVQHKAFHKAIEPVRHWYLGNTILAIVIDIVADLQKDRASVLKQAEHNNKVKEQITALGKEIDKLRTNNSKALEQIWNNLKVVKLHFC